MAKNMRKNNLKIQIVAGNSLNSFLNASYEKNVTLVLLLLIQFWNAARASETPIWTRPKFEPKMLLSTGSNRY